MVASSLSGFSVPTPMQELKCFHRGRNVRILMKREDLRDPEFGGNKWCKLMGHLVAAREHGYTRLLSVGGAWSNHLHALALAGRRFGFATTGIVRGEPVVTPALKDMTDAGMQIHFVSREQYRQRNSEGGLAALAQPFGPAWLIPEGGGGTPGLSGLALLAAEMESQVEGNVILAVPVGSGTTLAGLANVLPPRFRIWGFQTFHDDTLMSRIDTLLAEEREGASWALYPAPAMRAHRKLPAWLEAQMHSFENEQGIDLDPVYTVRMMVAIRQLLDDGAIPDSYTIVALHTGGLQGRRGHGLDLAA